MDYIAGNPALQLPPTVRLYWQHHQPNPPDKTKTKLTCICNIHKLHPMRSEYAQTRHPSSAWAPTTQQLSCKWQQPQNASPEMYPQLYCG